MKTMICLRARVMATLRRRSPPAWLSTPKFSGRSPCALAAKVAENRIVSRSSPCTFSRFLTNRPSRALSASMTRGEAISRRLFSMRSRWRSLKVMTPSEGRRSGQASTCRSTSSTTRLASRGLVFG